MIVDLTGQVAFVTGASRGIGQAIAAELARSGAMLALTGRDVAALRRTMAMVQGLGIPASLYPGDLSDATVVEELIRKVLSDHGHIDILVNNAGIAPPEHDMG